MVSISVGDVSDADYALHAEHGQETAIGVGDASYKAGGVN